MGGEAEAVEAGLRALRHRDLSTHDLRARLRERGFAEEECAAAVEALRRTGVLDDARFAGLRAAGLAERGAGDALIRHRLEAAGVEGEAIDEALAGLEPEHVRAEAMARRRGPGPRTARYLASKGFSEEAIRSVVAAGDPDEIG